ncbi:HD domain-containing protein [Moheibacter lacus]|uniref:HD domain-containing protein n=1 Tax=Moheibacter lacus TaxID=2745851 RepID=A0A838ZT14_9FLAO|nr:HD domain-containing protein [Moheibacter lacus]MBA5630093.1 HD domain-containing protein [Moheibacter lacus]
MEYVNKLKVFNDPVHGFISIPNELIFDIIQHPIFQRLRRICQTGLTEMVYPGAKHSRFHHALGAMFLMQKAIEELRAKNVEITDEEKNGVLCAILLHDIGHGPFSHTLENTLIEDLYHEKISLFLMEKLNAEFSGELDLAIQIFKGEYKKQFLTQLVSSQLDMDRLDYLKRDSFFTGVVEGNINPDRIISTLNVKDDLLVVDSKGIYSIEKYLTARMFMYWQVYNHRTSYTAEVLLTQAFRRAKEISRNGGKVFATDALGYFLQNDTKDSLKNQLDQFIKLDDSDVWASLKEWQYHEDVILSFLSRCLINRKLLVSKIFTEAVSDEELKKLEIEAAGYLGIENGDYFVHQSPIRVIPYDKTKSPIFIMNKDQSLQEISVSPLQILSEHLLNPIEKYHLCYLDVKKKI